MRNRVITGVVLAACALGATACTSTSPPASGGRKVFFVQPKNGDTIKTLSTFRFGNEQVTIAAVPPGELTPEQVRPGMTHYHIGVDTGCLPPGQVIPKADPWIHFGDGKSEIEMQLKPGQHKLVLQSGDDMHRTIEGLCETITVNVVE
jgi:Domain of unknown function (DUF4399)